jgi:hypothetical protein
MISRPLPPASPIQNVPPSPRDLELLVLVGRERKVLAGGFLAGLAVFFAPLVVLALGLLAAYLAYVVSDTDVPLLGLSGTLSAKDFRAVFAPAVNEAPLLACAGLVGSLMAGFRRWQSKRMDPSFVAAGMRPFFPEFALLYGVLVVMTLLTAATHGGTPQVRRLVFAAPVYLPFMLCVTWLAHSIWSYCFRNAMDLLASASERDAATALRSRVRRLRFSRER